MLLIFVNFGINKFFLCFFFCFRTRSKIMPNINEKKNKTINKPQQLQVNIQYQAPSLPVNQGKYLLNKKKNYTPIIACNNQQQEAFVQISARFLQHKTGFLFRYFIKKRHSFLNTLKIVSIFALDIKYVRLRSGV